MKKNEIEKDFIGLADKSEYNKDTAKAVSTEQIDFLKNLIDNFNVSTSRLEQAYSTLQSKFDRLNLKLEKTNQELKESLSEQERLSDYLTNILESLSSGVLVIDKSGTITLFNAGAELITGIKINDAINRHYDDVMGNEKYKGLSPLSALNSGEAKYQFEKKIYRPDGNIIPVGCSISPLMNKSGAVVGAVEIFMDISKIKILEEELAQKEKLAALGRMAATMAHKIRNPLGGIAGFAGLLRMETGRDEKISRLTGKIMDGVDKINKIITNLLAYTSVITIKAREVDLVVFISEILNSLKAEFPSVYFIFENPGYITAEIDPVRFRDALYNIFINAAESEAKRVSIIVSDINKIDESYNIEPGFGEILNDYIDKKGEIRFRPPVSIIYINDDGTGMDNTTVENLFVPFYTTKENGTGLGLAYSKKIIEAHRGDIRILSSTGHGTSVCIVLPAAGYM